MPRAARRISGRAGQPRPAPALLVASAQGSQLWGCPAWESPAVLWALGREERLSPGTLLPLAQTCLCRHHVRAGRFPGLHPPLGHGISCGCGGAARTNILPATKALPHPRAQPCAPRQPPLGHRASTPAPASCGIQPMWQQHRAELKCSPLLSAGPSPVLGPACIRSHSGRWGQ